MTTCDECLKVLSKGEITYFSDTENITVCTNCKSGLSVIGNQEYWNWKEQILKEEEQ